MQSLKNEYKMSHQISQKMFRNLSQCSYKFFQILLEIFSDVYYKNSLYFVQNFSRINTMMFS